MNELTVDGTWGRARDGAKLLGGENPAGAAVGPGVATIARGAGERATCSEAIRATAFDADDAVAARLLPD